MIIVTCDVILFWQWPQESLIRWEEIEAGRIAGTLWRGPPL
jgi:hypothetical protein